MGGQAERGMLTQKSVNPDLTLRMRETHNITSTMQTIGVHTGIAQEAVTHKCVPQTYAGADGPHQLHPSK